MALKYVRVGSMENVHVFDDGDFDSGLETDAPIKAATPVDGNDVVRLDDLDIFAEGPAAATDEAIARFDGTDGKKIQDSLATLNDAGSINIPNAQGYKVSGTQIITNQQAAEADVAVVSAISAGAGADAIDRTTFNTDLGTLVSEINAIKTTLNNLLAKLRTHGIIAT